ncbi:MAG: hypothetical protein LBH25_04665 [Fibromonadaceae bacterium]|nr:hypothetical protein [Fibromonadaceae bacterium]
MLAALSSIASCGKNSEKERERLQNEIAVAEDSLRVYQNNLHELSKTIDRKGDPSFLFRRVSDSIKGADTITIPVRVKINRYNFLLDSLRIRLRELPPPR